MFRFGFPLMLLVAVALFGCGDSAATGGGGASSSQTTNATTVTSSVTSSVSATSSSGQGGSPMPFTSEGDAIFESQTSIAATADGSIVVVWIAFYASDSAIGYATSHDGGASFTAPVVIHSPGGRLASNPSVVADAQGRFTLAWLGFGTQAGKPDEHVYVSRFDSATDTFLAPVIASDDGTSTTRDFDKPSLAVGPSDELLLTWADFTDNSMGVPASLVFARSADAITFDTKIITNDATFGNLASLCLDRSLGASAPLYLVHLGSGATVTLRVSNDGGQSWQLYSTPAASVVFQDPTCVARGNDLFVAYGTGTALFNPSEDSPADAVVVAHSPNGGQSFDPPVTASDGQAGMQYLFPRLISDATGKLEIVEYEGAVNSPATFVLASSTNGSTWTTSPIAPAGTFALDRTLANWLGDVVGLTPGTTTSFTSYADNSKGKSHVRFAEFAAP
jgi:hypothetical protein